MPPNQVTEWYPELVEGRSEVEVAVSFSTPYHSLHPLSASSARSAVLKWVGQRWAPFVFFACFAV